MLSTHRTRALTGVDEHGGEARTYAIDEDLILKVQRPPQPRPRTSLKKKAFFLQRLEGTDGVRVLRVLGHGSYAPGMEYTLMTRLPGISVRDAELTGETRRQDLFDLGAMMRRIHGVPQAPLLESRLFHGDHSPVDVRIRLGELFETVVALVEARPEPWDLPLSARAVAQTAICALPDADVALALHSNPGPEHVFVNPMTGRLSGVIDFGDAYFGHPANDLRQWPSPLDRHALLDGYISMGAVNENFLATWRVVRALADLLALAWLPRVRDEARAELEGLLEGWTR